MDSRKKKTLADKPDRSGDKVDLFTALTRRGISIGRYLQGQRIFRRDDLKKHLSSLKNSHYLITPEFALKCFQYFWSNAEEPVKTSGEKSEKPKDLQNEPATESKKKKTKKKTKKKKSKTA